MRVSENAGYKGDDKSYNIDVEETVERSTMLFNNLIWMTTEEAAFYLRKTTNAVRLLVFKGHLKARKFKRRLYFRRDELDTLIDTAFLTGGQ